MITFNTGVSFLGQSNAQISRLNNMRTQMDDLERQVGTQKKFETMTGFGLGTQRILQLHADRDHSQVFSDNIDSAVSNMTLMSNSMTKITDGLNKMISFLQNQPQDAQFNATDVNTQAQQMLDFITDVTNTNIAGRYLFAGTDTQNAPVADLTTLNANLQSEVTNWLSGATTTPQLLTNTDGLSGTALGFSPSISGAQDVTVRIDTNLEISYGAVADRSGIQDVLRSLAFMANIHAPNPATDVPTNAQFGTAIDHILATARSAVDAIQTAQGKMSGTLDLSKSIQDTHKHDINLFSSQIDAAENSDATSVIVQLQALQTQLQASYQVSHIVSQLSLTNYI
jgi:flagellin-like hook-associated protein FlgL